jgi:hypothetical protein
MVRKIKHFIWMTTTKASVATRYGKMHSTFNPAQYFQEAHS